MSEGCKVTKGVRQGCPLSTCIFVIAVELFATAVRHNVKIKALQKNNVEKINRFADDTVLIIAAEDESLTEAVKVIDHFKLISGLGMNKNKSTIVRIDSVAHSDFKLLCGKDFNWSEVIFTSLGINLSAETGEIPDLNYPERILKITTCLNIWRLKRLSTFSRVLIVKSMAISRLIYQLSMLPTPSSNCMDKIKDLLYQFIPNNKRDKNKRKVMNQDYTLGGYIMIDITVQNKALKLL